MADVLIVDDDPDLRKLMREILVDDGHLVREVLDGRSLLTLLRAALTPWVVVLDRRLPDMDGLEALALASAATNAVAPRHAFILCTAWGRPFTAEEQALLTQLQVAVVPKPFDIDTFSAQVAEAAKRIAAPS